MLWCHVMDKIKNANWKIGFVVLIELKKICELCETFVMFFDVIPGLNATNILLERTLLSLTSIHDPFKPMQSTPEEAQKSKKMFELSCPPANLRPRTTFINNIALSLQLTCMLRSAIFVPMTIIIVVKISIFLFINEAQSACMSSAIHSF